MEIDFWDFIKNQADCFNLNNLKAQLALKIAEHYFISLPIKLVSV